MDPEILLSTIVGAASSALLALLYAGLRAADGEFRLPRPGGSWWRGPYTTVPAGSVPLGRALRFYIPHFTLHRFPVVAA